MSDEKSMQQMRYVHKLDFLQAGAQAQAQARKSQEAQARRGSL